MSLYDDYRNTDYLDDISFIAGTTYTINFPIYTSRGETINILSSTMKWLLSPYGQPEYRILEKSATSSGSYTFVVTLNPADTISLGGVYLQQMEITDIAGNKTRPAQGIVVIRKAIPSLGTT